MGREYPQHPLPAVGALIVNGSRILLIKRAFEPSAGKWSIPGGAVELGERVEEAVRREVREEVGIEIEDVELLGIYDSIVRDSNGDVKYHYVIVEYLARARSPEVTPSGEVAGYAWVSLDELEKLEITPSLRETLRRYREKIMKYMKTGGE